MTFNYSTNTIAGRTTGLWARRPLSTLRSSRAIWAAASVLCATRWCTSSAASGLSPLAADDVHQRVAHRTEAAAQIARELLSVESGRRAQSPVVRPAIVFVE